MLNRPLLLTSLALTLAGCAGSYRGVESAHQPVVTRSDYALDLQAAPDGLASGEAQRLRGWLDALRLAYGDSIALDDPRGDADGARADVAAIAGSYGLTLAPAAPLTGGAVAPGAVRVTVTRTAAAVPSCSPQSNRGLFNFDARTSGDYGCSINGNLAAMVADPNDLVHGKSDTGGYDPLTGNKAIGALRRAQPSGAGGTAVRSESTGGK
ncbi:CpaD family pilus assembly lipoprotein [Sphingomonas sp. BK235]|jgi:pilus assembly protein CpaD|uniref:CpaD family pilus assembly lipoprotein n=1 Tax=Sphingomonas sp. BK235 TaxID=2512131 RepID=UPI00104E3DED|nr:CpaD family pilus assembly lipoprotein [Sphingomonas sp. BK235]TCP33123.1 pilus assembly protein CpaD [Sphingomonas sp. BK235]